MPSRGTNHPYPARAAGASQASRHRPVRRANPAHRPQAPNGTSSAASRKMLVDCAIRPATGTPYRFASTPETRPTAGTATAAR